MRNARTRSQRCQATNGEKPVPIYEPTLTFAAPIEGTTRGRASKGSSPPATPASFEAGHCCISI
ncbi:hypothetical protein M422DRAFT_30314, partial [Sphaerobolus stellatus SS14]